MSKLSIGLRALRECRTHHLPAALAYLKRHRMYFALGGMAMLCLIALLAWVKATSYRTDSALRYKHISELRETLIHRVRLAHQISGPDGAVVITLYGEEFGVPTVVTMRNGYPTADQLGIVAAMGDQWFKVLAVPDIASLTPFIAFGLNEDFPACSVAYFAPIALGELPQISAPVPSDC